RSTLFPYTTLFRSPNPAVADDIRKIATAAPGVARVEKCIVRKMGYHFFAEMHIEVDPQMTVQRAHQIAHEVKDKVRTQLPSVRDVLVHIEPAGQKTEMNSSQTNARSSAAEG